MFMNDNVRDVVMRGDIFFVDPFAIDVHGDLHDPPLPEVTDMAVSMHLHGQRRVVECTKVDGHRLRLDHGVIRTRAAQLICSGFKYIDPATNKEVVIKDKRFKLKVVISNVGIDEQEYAAHCLAVPDEKVGENPPRL